MYGRHCPNCGNTGRKIGFHRYSCENCGNFVLLVNFENEEI